MKASYIVILSEWSKDQELVFSPKNWIKTVLEILGIRHQIWPSLVKTKSDFDTT